MLTAWSPFFGVDSSYSVRSHPSRSWLIAPLPYGVGTTDPATFTAVPPLLIAAASSPATFPRGAARASILSSPCARE